MVHQPSLGFHFLHALYDFDKDKVVGEYKPEEHSFGFQIVLLVLYHLSPFFLASLTLPLSVAPYDQLVVFRFKVGGANILRAVGVLAEMSQKVYGVFPH